MKRFLTLSLLILTASSLALGQTANPSLLGDSTFTRQIAKAIRYPAVAHRQGLVTKAYVSFAVGDHGQIKDLKWLNSLEVADVFKEEITRMLEGLPDRNYKADGVYILPIKFVLQGANESKEPRDDYGQLIERSNKQSLLKEVVVVGYN